MVQLPITRRAPLALPEADLFDDLFRRFGRFPLMSQFQTDIMPWMPAIEVTEMDNEFVVTAELPGIAMADVDVKLENNVLTLWGKKLETKEEKEARCYVSERHYGEFQRSFTLPASVDADSIRAIMKEGVLTVHLPKTKASLGKKIQIRNG